MESDCPTDTVCFHAQQCVARSYAAALFWGTHGKKASEVKNNGTIFFLDCGQGPFAVTADHVYQEFSDQKEKSPEIKCQIDNLKFDPKERLIDHDSNIDIATFRINDREIEKTGKKVLTNPEPTWPPKPPAKGYGVFFAGFPGQERIMDAPSRVGFGIFSALCVATSVSDRQISCQIEEKHLIDTPDHPSAPADYDLGGVSGAPLLTLVEKGEIQYWRPGGVIRESHKELGIFTATRVDFILPDGRLRRDLFP